MSADDFQTKYSSVMEGMLKSAVAETTKLFETMVDELKEEISRLKKENYDLKIRNNHFENTKSQFSVYNRARETPHGTSHGFDKRDTAIQCDLVPLPTMMVEQCQPLRDLPQNQWLYQDVKYTLQEHNYVSDRKVDCRMSCIQVKQEDNEDDVSSLQSVLKQEEHEPILLSGQVLSEKAGVGASLATVCSTQSRGYGADLEDMLLPREDENTPVAQEVPTLEMSSGLQGVQNQTSEPAHSLVISLAEIKDDLEENSEMNLKISEIRTQPQFTLSAEPPLLCVRQPIEKHQPFMVLHHYQEKDEMLVSSTQTNVTLQQTDNIHLIVEQLAESTTQNEEVASKAVKTPITEGKSIFHSVFRKRERPAKKAKHLRQPGKAINSPSATTEQRMLTSLVGKVPVSSAINMVNTKTSAPLKVSPVKSKKALSLIIQSVQEKANAALKMNVDNQEVDLLSVSEVSLGKGYSTNNEQTQNVSMETKAVVKVPNKKALSANETYTPQTSSPEPRHYSTAVPLQDAMLLVDAMNQPAVENALSSPQTLVASPQTNCGPLLCKLKTRDEIPDKPATLRLSVVDHEITVRQPVTKLSTSRQSNVGTLKAARDAASNNRGTKGHFRIVIPNPQHVVNPFSATTFPVDLSAATRSRQQHTLHHLISVAPSNTAPPKISIPRTASVRMPPKIAALSSAQISAVVTTVAAAHNVSLRPTSIVPRSSLKTPSSSSAPQKTINLLPIVPSQSTVTSKDQQTASRPQSNMDITPRRSQSDTFVLSTKQDSTAFAAAASTPFSSSSQELTDSLNSHTSSNEVDTLSQVTDDTCDNLESETIAVPETTNTLLETSSSLNMPDVQAVASVFPVKQQGPAERFSAKVLLTRLPFLISTRESVLVSKLVLNRSSEPQSILKQSTSTDICPSLKEISNAASEKSPEEEPSHILEATPASSEKTTSLEGLEDGSYLQPSTSSSVPSADDPTCNLDKKITSSTVHIEEKQPTTSIKLTAISSKDDPHLQMTKTQFLEHLAVSPIVPASEKVSTNDPPDGTVCGKKTLHNTSLVARLRHHLKPPLKVRIAKANPETCMNMEATTVSKNVGLENGGSNNTRKAFPKSPTNAVVVVDVATLNRSSKDHNGPVSPGLCEDYVTSKRSVSGPSTAISRRSKHTWNRTSSGIGIENKKSRSVNPRWSSLIKDNCRPKNTKSVSMSTNGDSVFRQRNTKSLCFTPKRASTVRDVTSTKMAKYLSVSRKRTILTRDGAIPKNTNPASVSPRRTSSTRGGASPKNTNPASVSPRRTSSTRGGASPKNANPASVSPRRTSSTRGGASPKNANPASVSPRRTSSTRGGASPKNANPASVSPRRTSSTRGGASPKNANPASVSPRRTRSTRGGASPKNTNPVSVSPRRTSSTTGGASISESMFFDHRRSSCAEVKSNLTITDGVLCKKAKSDPASPSSRLLGKDGVGFTMTGGATPKKSRLSEHITRSKKNLRVVNAKKLAKAAKAKTLAKMKILQQQRLENGVKTTQQAGNQANCEVVKKIISKAVWIPPKMPITKTPKKETGSLHHTAVHPRTSVYPIPVKPVPIVSPLQPLLVIDGHLLKNQCGECGRILSSSAALESHVGLHTGHRPFSCTFCGKSFPDTKSLKRHGRVHRNGRIHVCPQCGKGFVYKFGLTKHLQLVHGRLKPFVCQICSKGFYTKRDVEAHIRIHTGEKPFRCNICEKPFARRVELNVHLRWHNGEKRHWCPYCGKGFLDFNNLKRHKYVHTGEKPHPCPHCNKHFSQSGHLKKHVKNVHKIE